MKVRRVLEIAGHAGVFLLVLLTLKLTTESDAFPVDWREYFPLRNAVNQLQDWLDDNFSWFIRGVVKAAIDFNLDKVERFLTGLPWLVILFATVLPALKLGGLRLALFCAVGVMFWGVVDLWEAAMETLALMVVSVFLSVVLGVLLGILASLSDTFEAIVRPILDAFQTFPPFVYLIPALVFLGIGGAPAVVATVSYAVVPAVRLTNLGIRQVSPQAVEVAKSFGSTSFQIMMKVKLPLAIPSVMLGINQTIMMALGMVVIAAFVGAAGLGLEVWRALWLLKIGAGFEGGLAILFMAVILDRFSGAIGNDDRESRSQQEGGFKLLPSRMERFESARAFERALAAIYGTLHRLSQFVAAGIAGVVARIYQGVSKGGDTQTVQRFFRRHSFSVTGAALLLVLLAVDAFIVGLGEFPLSWQYALRNPIEDVNDWLKVNAVVVATTSWINSSVFHWLLNPLTDFLQWLPWSAFILGVVQIARASAGWRVGVFSAFALMFIGVVGLWEQAMETLAVVFVSVFLCVLTGFPLGVLAARSNAFEAFLRPVLDAMQTLPSFVYLLPVIMLFGGGKVSAVIATMVYAIVPLIRLTNLGIREVSAEVIEAAESYGSTSSQTLLKVQLPLALPSIMMGINQTVMMALAMVIIAFLIGGGGLGYQVYYSLGYLDTGGGFEAGLSIVVMAIILDRITQGWSERRQAVQAIQ